MLAGHDFVARGRDAVDGDGTFYGEPRLDHFLDSHPGMKTQLERNPDLIYNRNFRKQHPDLEAFMQNHPNVWGKLAGSGRWGAYGPDHNWHEADWWHEHDPGWLYKNHPEWAENIRTGEPTKLTIPNGSDIRSRQCIPKKPYIRKRARRSRTSRGSRGAPPPMTSVCDPDDCSGHISLRDVRSVL